MDEVIERLRASQARFLGSARGVGDPAAPSRLPGWTVGHLLTHVARNADSAVRRLEGAARDEIVDQYPGGAEGRAAEIEAGAGRGLDELVEDIRRTGDAVVELASSLDGVMWERLTRSVDGELATAKAVLRGRIREVEVHHVDLGAGYTPEDWPAWFVGELLAEELPKLDRATTLAWLIGRGPAPMPGPWR